jgi:hypothetical protein
MSNIFADAARHAIAADAPGVVASAGPNHRIAPRPGARCTYVAFNTDAPNVAEATAGTPGDIIRLTDEEGGFAQGVPGFSESLDGLLVWLRDSSGGLPLRLVGEGAGGSMALIAGLLLPRISFLAVNPLPHPSVSEPQEGAVAHPFWGDIASWGSAYPAHQQGVTALNAWDAAGAAVLGYEEFILPAYGTLVELPCRGSGIAYLRRKGALGALFERGGDGVRRLRDESVLGRAQTYGTPQQFRAFHEAHLAMAAKGGSARKRAMRLVEREAEWNNPGWQFLRANVLRREKLLPEALAAAGLAVAAGPEVVEFCVLYGRLARELENAEAAARAADLLNAFLRQRGIAELRDALLALA